MSEAKLYTGWRGCIWDGVKVDSTAMRLVAIGGRGGLSFSKEYINDIPSYAILSRTSGTNDEEATFADLKMDSARTS
jgi:hypothetical protein